MKIIKVRESYSSKMLRKLLPAAWVLLALISVAAILIFLPIFIPALAKYWWALIIVSVIIFALAKEPLELLTEDIKNFRYGKEGEEEVKEMLQEILDDDYIYIENYIIPNTRIGDIDGLLIGPKGIIILEIKNYAGFFRISGGDMERKLRGDIYKIYRRNPFWQVIRQKEYLAKFLSEKGISIPVFPVVVLVEGRIEVIKGETKAFIIEIDKLTNHIFELNPIPNWSEELSNKILTVLGLEQTKQKVEELIEK